MCEQLTREMRPDIILVVSVVKTTTNQTKQKTKTEKKLTTNLTTSDRVSVFGDLRRKQCKLICIVTLS